MATAFEGSAEIIRTELRVLKEPERSAYLKGLRDGYLAAGTLLGDQVKQLAQLNALLDELESSTTG